MIVSLSFGSWSINVTPFALFIIPFYRIRIITRWVLANIRYFSWRPPCQLIGKGGYMVMSK
ncbi:hypothetical protein BJV82DRAFT_105998 [Fennellomyces sp. T-0311]|nr:hypothetical protein BJV82DRAFT_105998 [Fennellomyces sp. T-0311]